MSEKIVQTAGREQLGDFTPMFVIISTTTYGMYHKATVEYE